MLKEAPAVGRYLVYSSRFVVNMAIAIGRSLEVKEERGDHRGPEETTSNFLYPRAPEDFLRIGDLATMWHIDPATLKRIINESNEVLGPVATYMCTWLSRSKPTPHYNPDQQAILHYELEKRGLFAETAPEDVDTTIELEALWVITRPTIKLLVNELGDRLGIVAIYRTRRGRNAALHYSPEQQAIILQEAERRHMLVEAAPEGVLSASGFAQQLGIDAAIVLRAVSKLKSQLGEVKRYRFAGQRTDGYTPVQQKLLRQYIDRAEAAPENYLTIDGMAKAFGITYQPVKNAADKLADVLGEVGTYKFYTGIMTGYSPAQQRQIHGFLAAKHLFVEQAPQGFVNQKKLADQLGVAGGTVVRALEYLGDELGEVKIYRFHSQSVPGYSPEQQALIKSHLEAKGALAKAATDGVLSSNGISKACNISVEVVNKAIKELGEKLGDVKSYMFRRPAPGYTLEQQVMIQRCLADHLNDMK